MKPYFSIILFFAAGITCHAQKKSNIRIGVKLAPEISIRIAGWEPGPGYSYTFGQLGFTTGIQVLLFNHLETGLYYYHQTVIQNNRGYDIRYSTQFLHIPVVWRQEVKNFYFTLGSSINVSLGFKETIENQTTIGTVTFTGSNGGNTPIAFGVQASVGYTFKISSQINFFTEVRLGDILYKYAPSTLGIGVGVNKSF